MPWIFFLLALGCFAIVTKTQSMAVALICLVAALGFIVAGALGLVSGRIQSNSQSAASMLSGPELALARRKQAEKQAAAAGGGEGASDSGNRRARDDHDNDSDASGSDGGDGGGGD